MPKYKLTLADGTTQIIQSDKPPEVGTAYTPESYASKVGKDILQTGMAVIPGISALQGYKFGKKALAPAVSKALNVGPESSIMARPEIAKKLGYETEDRYKPLKEIGKSMAEPYLHPIQSLKEGKLASTAVAWGAPALGIKSLLKGGVKTSIPEAVAGAEKAGVKTLPVSKVLAGKLEHSTVENVGKNPYVQKGMSIYAAEDMDKAVNQAAEATISVKDKMNLAENYIYKKNGVTDDIAVPIDKTLENIENKVNEFSKSAIGENKKIATQAQALVEDLKTQAKLSAEGKPALSFGQAKSLTRQIYDTADSHINENGKFTEAGHLYNDIGAELTKAKNSIPHIEKSAEVYKDFLEANKTVREIYRLDRMNGEQNLNVKIKNRFRDDVHQPFKDEIDKVGEILKKHKDILKENPETADLINEFGNADFADKIKLVHALQDVNTKRMITPLGVGRIPALAYLLKATKVGDPLHQMVFLKKGIQKGWINPESLSKEIPVSQNIFGGKTISRLRALRELRSK